MFVQFIGCAVTAVRSFSGLVHQLWHPPNGQLYTLVSLVFEVS